MFQPIFFEGGENYFKIKQQILKFIITKANFIVTESEEIVEEQRVIGSLHCYEIDRKVGTDGLMYLYDIELDQFSNALEVQTSQCNSMQSQLFEIRNDINALKIELDQFQRSFHPKSQNIRKLLTSSSQGIQFLPSLEKHFDELAKSSQLEEMEDESKISLTLDDISEWDGMEVEEVENEIKELEEKFLAEIQNSQNVPRFNPQNSSLDLIQMSYYGLEFLLEEILE